MALDIASVKQAFESYVAGVQAMIAQHKADVNSAVDKAIAAHDKDCETDLQSLRDEIAEAGAKLQAPPVPPFEPSNN